jgi:hypothetical protein
MQPIVMSMPGAGDIPFALQHNMGNSGVPQARRGRQTGWAGANHHNV